MQLHYHARPPAGCQTVHARQKFRSNGEDENRTGAAVEDQQTLGSPSAGGQRSAQET